MPKKKISAKTLLELQKPLRNPGIMSGSHNGEPVYWAIKPFLQTRIKWALHSTESAPATKKNYKND